MRRLLLALALLTGGCAEELTEIIVVVDSDLQVPEDIDTVVIEVISPSGDVRRATARLTGERGLPLPRSLGVVHRGGPLYPLTVFVQAEGAQRVQRHGRVAFVPGETRVLRMDLWSACVGKMCGPDETCGDAQGQCRSREVSEEELEPWNGGVQGLDGAAGPVDGGDGGFDGGADGCVPTEEICNDRDDDCDGVVDEGFELQTDPANCGSCGNVCAADPPNASGTCSTGECILECDPGWANCDDMMDTGCEALLSRPETCGDCETTCSGAEPFCSGDASTTFACVASCGVDTTECGGSCVDTSRSAQHCGECDNVCVDRPNARPTCTEGTCDFLCDGGWHDCDGTADNGCESQLKSLDHCGACGATCDLPDAMESCTTGSCVIVGCESGFGDCNMVASDGCESQLADDPMNCGACGNVCPPDPPNASSLCVDGRCVIECHDGFADCDEDPSNGCEASLSTTDTCGSCGIRCEGSTPLCASDGTGGYTCVSGCATGQERCGDSCVDTDSDPSHCGSCGNACGPAGSCCNGACCPGSRVCCADVCCDIGEICRMSSQTCGLGM